MQRVLSCWLLGTMVATVGVAQSDGAAGHRPPFVPASASAKNVPLTVMPNRLDHLEFRGVLSVAGQSFITLVDMSSSRSLTVPLNGSVDGVAVFDLRVDDGTVQARTAGQVRVLPLREAKIVAVTPPPSPRPLIHVYRRPLREGVVDPVAQEIIRRQRERQQLLEAEKSANVSPDPRSPAGPNP